MPYTEILMKRKLNLALWIVAAILAVVFLVSSSTKVIVPTALAIAPVLVPLAGTGAVLLFAGAVIMRLRRGERATIVADLAYLAMAAFVALGRFGPASFTRPTQRAAFSRARLHRIARRGLLDRG